MQDHPPPCGLTLAKAQELGRGFESRATGWKLAPPPALLSPGQGAFWRRLRPRPPPARSCMQTLSPIHSAFKGLLSEPGSRANPQPNPGLGKHAGPLLAEAAYRRPACWLPARPGHRPTSEIQGEAGREASHRGGVPQPGVWLTLASASPKDSSPFHLIPSAPAQLDLWPRGAPPGPRPLKGLFCW